MGKKLPKYLKEDEVRKLLNAPERQKTRDRLILRILYRCGLRVSELTSLRIEDIDVEEGMITVRGGKGDKDRVVPIDDDTLDLIQLYKDDAEEGVLILSQRNEPLSTRQVERIVKKYADKTDIKKNVYPHMLRHSFAVHCLKSGMNLRSVQKMLGHSSLTTTQIYLDLTGEDVKKDYENHPLPA
ncbi:MAG: tyrosine-type recombinase/integrase [Candidatus Thermoplasmatota archaeon]|nr:tyrosine-type recombinase/integrase [Candidatus Thermoplasmatota archaeon]